AKTAAASGARRRTASSTFRVPRALTWKSVSGSVSEVVTATCAARWMTASCPGTASATAAPSRTSTWTLSTRCCDLTQSRLRRAPVRLKLSSSVSLHPWRAKWSAMLTPMNPAPPVMRRLRPATSARQQLGLAPEVVDRQLQPALQGHPRLPAQLASGLAAVERDPAHVARALRAPARLSAVAGDLAQAGEDLVHAH